MKDTRTISERFAEFHSQHPEVFEKFVEFAFEARRRGHRRYSAGTLLELVRWHTSAGDNSGVTFKINDHFRSRYARMLVAEYPEFAGFLEFRTLKSA